MSDSPQEKSKKPNSRFKSIFGRKDNQAKIFFLFLAVFLWLLLNLSKDEAYTQWVNFPVDYTNLPKERELKNNPPNEIKVRLKASGFDLLKYKLNSFSPFVVDIASLQGDEVNLLSYWYTNGQRDFLQNQLDDDVEVLDISPDTIVFEYKRLVSKRVPVVLNLKTDFDAFTTLYDKPNLTPDSVLLTGNTEDLQKIDSVMTRQIVLDENAKEYDAEVKLMTKDIDGLKYSRSSVSVKFKVAKLTEKVFEQELELRGLPEDIEMVLFPKKVTVKTQLALSDFDLLQSIQVRAFVEVQKAMEDDGNFLTVQLDQLPKYVRHYTIEPKRVEYIISKQQE